METNKLDILQYTNYVHYLRDMVEQRRKTGHFTFRDFCEKSGFKSPTYLKWVLDEIRPISPKSVEKFAIGLDLGKRETRYLELMVNYKESREIHKKRFFFEQMLTQQNKNTETPFVRERYEYLSHWYYVAIRELIGLPHFQEDPNWIKQKLCGTLSLWDIKHAIDTLLKLELIRRDKQGKLVQNSEELHTGPEVESMAAFNYHFENLEIAKEQLLQTSHRIREYLSLVAPMDVVTFHAIKKKMQTFQAEIVQLIQSQQKSAKANKAQQEIFLLNLQLAPMTQFHENQFLKNTPTGTHGRSE